MMLWDAACELLLQNASYAAGGNGVSDRSESQFAPTLTDTTKDSETPAEIADNGWVQTYVSSAGRRVHGRSF